MVDGDSTAAVTVTVLTSSIETTDLNVVNLLAGHVLKAFAEHAQAHRNPRAAGSASSSTRRAAGPSSRSQQGVGVRERHMVGSANTDVRSYMMDSNARSSSGAPTPGAPISGTSRDHGRPRSDRDLTDYFAASAGSG
jgi:hypothetical protein